MKKILYRLTACVLSFCMIIAVFTFLFSREADAAVTKYSYNSDSPFFNDYMDQTYSLDNSASLDIFFDTLPPTENTSNFCSLATTEYENINGRTVTVDTFARLYNESLNDPNFGEGILIYQCIQYKVRHPEEDVRR